MTVENAFVPPETPPAPETTRRCHVVPAVRHLRSSRPVAARLIEQHDGASFHAASNGLPRRVVAPIGRAVRWRVWKRCRAGWPLRCPDILRDYHWAFRYLADRGTVDAAPVSPFGPCAPGSPSPPGVPAGLLNATDRPADLTVRRALILTAPTATDKRRCHLARARRWRCWSSTWPRFMRERARPHLQLQRAGGSDQRMNVSVGRQFQQLRLRDPHRERAARRVSDGDAAVAPSSAATGLPSRHRGSCARPICILPAGQIDWRAVDVLIAEAAKEIGIAGSDDVADGHAITDFYLEIRNADMRVRLSGTL